MSDTATDQRVQIPYRPRPPQREFARRFRRARFGVLVCHRRLGKSVMAVNLLQQGGLACTRPRPRFALVAPTYRQAKLTVWDYLQHFSRPIPGIRINQSELRVDYPNDAQVRLFGADNPDALRGIYLDGVVCDEYGLFPSTAFSEVIAPTLVDRGGWALIAGTPNGKNQFYDMAVRAQAQQAAGDPEWIYGEYRASQTGLLDAAFLASARAVMTQDEYDQEFECSWTAAVKGSIFAGQLQAAQDEGRIGQVPIDTLMPVHTAWDLGVGDSTAIWWWQITRGGEVRCVDYHTASGEGIPHYLAVLQQRQSRGGYAYGRHWAPPDIRVRELGSGKSRLEIAKGLGLTFDVVSDIGLEDGISAARLVLGRTWFDATRCQAGIEALRHYRRDYNSRLAEFTPRPVHDWASHGADAFRYLAVAAQPAKPVKPAPTQRPMFQDAAAVGTGWMA